METYDQLMEQARELGIVRNDWVRAWLECREDYKELQQDPLDVYINRLKFMRDNIRRAESRENGWPVEIDEIDCYLVGVKQGWRCALTGDLLEFTRGGGDFNNQWANPKSCTNDRIDPYEGYVPGNIQLVTWEANLFKQGFTMRELQVLCTKIVHTQKWAQPLDQIAG